MGHCARAIQIGYYRPVLDSASERRLGPREGETLRAWIARVDPEVLAAVADVDRTLLRDSLATPIRVRLERCTRAAQRALRFRRVEPTGG